MIIKHIKENSFFYLGFILLFSVGISLGAYWVTNVSIETKELLIMYLNGFLILLREKYLIIQLYLKAHL